ncbi:hypothetical protein BHE74_00032053 [Ensete ventricosum]|nr:hypothetical protein BHE74_00032053 [Ensete ventricosum]
MADAAEWMEQKLSLDSESKYGGARLEDQDQEVSTDVAIGRGYGRRGCSRWGRATRSSAGLGRIARALRRRSRVVADPTGEYRCGPGWTTARGQELGGGLVHSGLRDGNAMGIGHLRKKWRSRLSWKKASVLPSRGERSKGGRLLEEAREGEGVWQWVQADDGGFDRGGGSQWGRKVVKADVGETWAKWSIVVEELTRHCNM